MLARHVLLRVITLLLPPLSEATIERVAGTYLRGTVRTVVNWCLFQSPSESTLGGGLLTQILEDSQLFWREHAPQL